jgi:hypothetical protein
VLERDPIDLIKEQLSGIEKMAGLHADHETFKQWHAETKTILEKVFSSKSIHCQSFLALRFREMSVKAFASPEIHKINAQRFKKDLENVKNTLQELTLDRTLFKKIQTTPKTVEVSLKGEYFVSSGISDVEMMRAIESAFESSGLTPLYGAPLHPKEEPLSQRIEQIRRTRFGIYPLPGPEGMDVLLEIGIALGLGKEIVVLCEKGSLPSDALKQLDLIEYENLSNLTEELKKK